MEGGHCPSLLYQSLHRLSYLTAAVIASPLARRYIRQFNYFIVDRRPLNTQLCIVQSYQRAITRRSIPPIYIPYISYWESTAYSAYHTAHTSPFLGIDSFLKFKREKRLARLPFSPAWGVFVLKNNIFEKTSLRLYEFRRKFGFYLARLSLFAFCGR